MQTSDFLNFKDIAVKCIKNWTKDYSGTVVHWLKVKQLCYVKHLSNLVLINMIWILCRETWSRLTRFYMRRKILIFAIYLNLCQFCVWSWLNGHELRGHDLMLYKQYNRLNIRKHFFSQRVIDAWNQLPPSVVDAASLVISQTRGKVTSVVNASVQSLYRSTKPPSISTAKYKHLQDLCKSFCVKEEYHAFYTSLPHSASDRDMLPEPDIDSEMSEWFQKSGLILKVAYLLQSITYWCGAIVYS